MSMAMRSSVTTASSSNCQCCLDLYPDEPRGAKLAVRFNSPAGDRGSRSGRGSGVRAAPSRASAPQSRLFVESERWTPRSGCQISPDGVEGCSNSAMCAIVLTPSTIATASCTSTTLRSQIGDRPARVIAADTSEVNPALSAHRRSNTAPAYRPVPCPRRPLSAAGTTRYCWTPERCPFPWRRSELDTRIVPGQRHHSHLRPRTHGSIAEYRRLMLQDAKLMA